MSNLLRYFISLLKSPQPTLFWPYNYKWHSILGKHNFLAIKNVILLFICRIFLIWRKLFLWYRLATLPGGDYILTHLSAWGELRAKYWKAVVKRFNKLCILVPVFEYVYKYSHFWMSHINIKNGHHVCDTQYRYQILR